MFRSPCSWPVRRLRLRHGRDVRRGDARREPPGAPRRPVGDLALGHRRRDLPARRASSSFQDIAAAIAEGQAFGFPIATTIKENLHGRSRRLTVRRALPRRDPRRGLRLHARDPGRDRRLMFSMGRDRRLPLGGLWGTVNPHVQDAGERGGRRRRARRDPVPRDRRPGRRSTSRSRRPALIYISYFMCNIGVLIARRRGWPHKGAWFKLGSWGTIINILALVWGGADDHQHRPLDRSELFGDFGDDLRDTWSEPVHQHVHHVGGKPIAGLPDMPFFETTRRRRSCIVGAALLRRRPARPRGPASRPTSRPARR